MTSIIPKKKKIYMTPIIKISYFTETENFFTDSTRDKSKS